MTRPDPKSELFSPRFVQEDWQEGPRLFKGAIDPQSIAFGPEDFFQLASEETADVRRIHQPASGGWAVESGPISEDWIDTRLDDERWTVLLQEADHWDQRMAELRTRFHFLPDWRLDDVMVSYSNSGGGVGPHFDLYDVFLVQGTGTRRWRLESTKRQHLPEGTGPLRQVDDFQGDLDWQVQPGDVVYIPPGFAHWGGKQLVGYDLLDRLSRPSPRGHCFRYRTVGTR